MNQWTWVLAAVAFSAGLARADDEPPAAPDESAKHPDIKPFEVQIRTSDDFTFKGNLKNSSADVAVNRAGAGVGMDVGVLFTPTPVMKPTFGLSITDLGGSTYTKATPTAGQPNPRFPSVNAGISVRPIEKNGMYVLCAMDGDMLNQPVHYSHKLNFGAEWGYSELIKVQTGLKEGYLTAGLQFDVGLLNLRLVTYAVDHAPVVGANKDLVERRFAFQLKLLI